MAEGLMPTVTQTPRLAVVAIPGDPDQDDYAWRMEGDDPEVQLFNGAAEEKIGPNYSDYKRAKGELQ